MPTKPSLWLILSFGLILAAAALLLIPSINQSLVNLLGMNPTSPPAVAYNGFDAFIPFIPGYFPKDFTINYAKTNSHTSQDINSYTETYASDNYFFRTYQSQGPKVPAIHPDPALNIQGQPASITSTVGLAHDFLEEDLDMNRFDTREVWLIQFILEEIHIQVITNLPRDEALQVAEGLIPSICTSTPTPDGQEQ